MTELELERYLLQLTDLLKPLGSPRRSLAAKDDKNSKLEFLAVRVPILKKIATKDCSLAHLNEAQRLEVWDFFWRNSPYYEVMAVALFHYRCQGLKVAPTTFAVIKNWVERIENWGHCDEFSYILSCLMEQNPKKLLPYLFELNNSHDIWKIRISIVSTVHYAGKNSVYLAPEDVFPLLSRHIGNKNKYIAKAVGWVLREMRRKYPVQIEEFVMAHRNQLSAVALKISGVQMPKMKPSS
jgi:3-methyladenine DNA glycosylase AlkD